MLGTKNNYKQAYSFETVGIYMYIGVPFIILIISLFFKKSYLLILIPFGIVWYIVHVRKKKKEKYYNKLKIALGIPKDDKTNKIERLANTKEGIEEIEKAINLANKRIIKQNKEFEIEYSLCNFIYLKCNDILKNIYSDKNCRFTKSEILDELVHSLRLHSSSYSRSHAKKEAENLFFIMVKVGLLYNDSIFKRRDEKNKYRYIESISTDKYCYIEKILTDKLRNLKQNILTNEDSIVNINSKYYPKFKGKHL